MGNLNITKDMVFIAADGDGIGKQVGRAVIANDTDELHKISARIDAAQDFILHWARENDGVKISGGGDEFTAAIPKAAIANIEGLRKDIEHAFGYTISVGVGKSLSEAGTALLVAKLRGKDRIVFFTEKVKYDIKKAKRRVREKRASPDEYKLADAYLTKSEGINMDKPQMQECPFCEQTDKIDPTHCKFCHDAEVAEGESGCPLCDQAPQADQGCPLCVQSPEDADDCPFCQDDKASGQKQPELAAQDDNAAKENLPVSASPEDDSYPAQSGEIPEQNPKIQSPDSNNAQAPAGSVQEKQNYNEMGMSPPAIGKPSIGNNSSPAGEGQSNTMYDTAGAPVEPANAEGSEVEAGDGTVPVEGAHSKEDLQAIAEQIARETVDGNPDDAQVAQGIDDTDLTGGSMEGNVSRPPGYEENTPADMGLDEQNAQEENPDLSSVLKEGLDNHASDIDKDKVRDMVGQALSGFKASKNILERAKEQAPEFYQSSIAMLAAMIKMAEMLGLSGAAQAQPGQPAEAQSGQPGSDNDWKDPFPKHPDHGGEAKPGHAPSKGDSAQAPKDKAPIGQPIGKLPSKATQHVARTPLPPGAINAKGQQKVIDPKTGDTRFIDRKKGMVQSTTGVPVKPPGRGSE